MIFTRCTIAAPTLAMCCLAGCISIDPADRPAPVSDRCAIALVSGMVGRPDAALPPLPPGSRVVGPDSIVTKDYVPARLNVLVDARSIVTGGRCG